MKRPHGMADFTGRWQIARRIDDRRAGQVISGQGEAVFAADGAGRLVLDEALTLHLPGQPPVQGRRRYLWVAAEGGIDVLFEDGRFFHRIALGRAQAEDRHHCPPDHYAGSHDFSRWPDWEARWRVRGPRKDYLMVTVYRRQAGA